MVHRKAGNPPASKPDWIPPKRNPPGIQKGKGDSLSPFQVAKALLRGKMALVHEFRRSDPDGFDLLPDDIRETAIRFTTKRMCQQRGHMTCFSDAKGRETLAEWLRNEATLSR